MTPESDCESVLQLAWYTRRGRLCDVMILLDRNVTKPPGDCERTVITHEMGEGNVWRGIKTQIVDNNQ